MSPVKVSAGYEKWVRGDERTVSGTIGTRSAATTTKNKPSSLGRGSALEQCRHTKNKLDVCLSNLPPLLVLCRVRFLFLSKSPDHPRGYGRHNNQPKQPFSATKPGPNLELVEAERSFLRPRMILRTFSSSIPVSPRAISL
jgi:hypothetical protein